MKLETEYIAPDLLPDREEVAAEIDAMWPGHAPGGELTVDLPFLHPGVMRGLISRIGREAGISAVYWKYGAALYERTTGSHALIEQRVSDRPNTWSGQVKVSTRGGRASELLEELREWIERVLNESGCRGWQIRDNDDRARPARAPQIDRHQEREAGAEDPPPEPKLVFTQPPAGAITCFVSYARNRECLAMVDRLCERARACGKTVLRDSTAIGIGESITRFMQRLGAGDRVFVILSDDYVKSPYCMYELLEIWRNCQMNDEHARRRISAFCLPGVRISTPAERMRCAIYWRDQFKELDALVREHGADLLGAEDFKRYKLMQDFAHRVGDMLSLIADTLRPTDFEELLARGLGD